MKWRINLCKVYIFFGEQLTQSQFLPRNYILRVRARQGVEKTQRLAERLPTPKVLLLFFQFVILGMHMPSTGVILVNVQLWKIVFFSPVSFTTLLAVIMRIRGAPLFPRNENKTCEIPRNVKQTAKCSFVFRRNARWMFRRIFLEERGASWPPVKAYTIEGLNVFRRTRTHMPVTPPRVRISSFILHSFFFSFLPRVYLRNSKRRE